MFQSLNTSGAKPFFRPLFCACLIGILFLFSSCKKDSITPAIVWNLFELNVEGPQTDEMHEINPFTNYRMEVTFTAKGESKTYPGFFNADGNALETSASGGNIWTCRFRPSQSAKYEYEVKFYKGEQAYKKSVDELEYLEKFTSKGNIIGVAFPFKGNDIRNKGKLYYANDFYYQNKQTKRPYIKGGPNCAKHLLSYSEFDKSSSIYSPKPTEKNWQPHIQDWRDGDPTWKNKKGKGLIGALNYIAEKGMNSLQFQTMNIEGNGEGVSPYVNHTDFTRFDVSKLAQWNLVFEHAQNLGIVLHLVTQKSKNERLPNRVFTASLRQLYYRELVARFGHHLGLIWNLAEENGYAGFQAKSKDHPQRYDLTQWFAENNPYQNPLVSTASSALSAQDTSTEYSYKNKDLDGLSIQIGDYKVVHGEILNSRKRSKENGHPLVITTNELGENWIGVAPDDASKHQDSLRKEVLWATYMAGGSCVELNVGCKNLSSDVACQDLRSRDLLWNQTKAALSFFKLLPVAEMVPADHLLTGPDNWCFTRLGSLYAVYLKNGGNTTLDLSKFDGNFTGLWYNPRTGKFNKPLKFKGAQKVKLKSPGIGNEDWALLLKKVG